MLLITEGEPIPNTIFTDTFDTKYRAENLDSHTDISPYRHIVAIIIHLFAPIYINTYIKHFMC